MVMVIKYIISYYSIVKMLRRIGWLCLCRKLLSHSLSLAAVKYEKKKKLMFVLLPNEKGTFL